MNHLIGSPLDHVEIEAGSIALWTSYGDICVLRTASFRDSRSLEKRVEILFDMPKNRPPLPIDESRVKQVLSNLIGNAVKFTPPFGAPAADADRMRALDV